MSSAPAIPRRYEPPALARIDHRSRRSWRLRRRLAELAAPLGDPAHVTPYQWSALGQVLLLEEKLQRDGPAMNAQSYAAVSNTLVGLLKAAGLSNSAPQKPDPKAALARLQNWEQAS